MAFSKKQEVKTLLKIISIDCNHKHNTHKDKLCEECLLLFEYAEKKIESCVYGDGKPVCSGCYIHCYSPEMREKIIGCMKYAGPKMIYKSPILTIRYLYRKVFKSRHDTKGLRTKKL